jgi:hypothetical protein
MWLKQLTELKRKPTSGQRGDTSAQLPNNLTPLGYRRQFDA